MSPAPSALEDPIILYSIVFTISFIKSALNFVDLTFR